MLIKECTNEYHEVVIASTFSLDCVGCTHHMVDNPIRHGSRTRGKRKEANYICLSLYYTFTYTLYIFYFILRNMEKLSPNTLTHRCHWFTQYITTSLSLLQTSSRCFLSFTENLPFLSVSSSFLANTTHVCQQICV